LLDLLDNIVWHSLAGPHAKFAEGTSTARRYARGFSPLTGFADPAHPDLDALAPFTDLGEHLFCGGWTGSAAHDGWRVDAEVPAVQLIWDGIVPASAGTRRAHAAGTFRPAHRRDGGIPRDP
jgi:hypothetical protein